MFERFVEFQQEAERQFGNKLKCLRSDNGGEYSSKEFSEYLKQQGIKRQLTCPHTPQQNGVAERKNRHLAVACRSMMHSKNVPTRFWAEGMKTATYVINRLPQRRLNFESPYEKMFNIQPNVSHLRVFDCVCYVFVPDCLRSKMEKKAVRCIFTGYDSERKGWRCIEPSTGKCHVSRNVVFDEASSWWSLEYTTLPDSKELELQVQEKIQSGSDLSK